MHYRPSRHTTNISVWLITTEARIQVRMVDISPHGARMVGDFKIKRPQSVTIENLGVQFHARVAWTHMGSAGVVFSNPLSDKEIDNFRRVERSEDEARDFASG